VEYKGELKLRHFRK